MGLTILLLQILSCIYLALAVDITGTIVWNDVCPNSTTLGQAKVVLGEGILGGGIKRDGTFLIPNVSNGTYILSVISHDFTFDQLRIDVSNSRLLLPEVRPYIVGTSVNPPSSIILPYPIELSAKEKHEYFMPPESFNLAAMMSNPMMLLMVGGAVMMLALPYLIKNMDPEALQEFKEQIAPRSNDDLGHSSVNEGQGSTNQVAQGNKGAAPGAGKGRATKKSRK